MAVLGNLSEDVIIEILSLLPVESLLRFKCVCKFWCARINDPKFVRKHLSNSPQHDHVLLKCSKPEYFEQMENIFSIFSLDQFESSFDVHSPSNENILSSIMCGHSHGLICLSNTETDICLWNPTTREFRELPPSILHLTKDRGSYNSHTNTVGFGYDPKSKDLKVVRIVDFDDGGYTHFWRMEIYNLRTDRWREIESLVCDADFPSFTSYSQMHNEGTYYWLGQVFESFEIILTFDMSEEVFDKISIPEEIEDQIHKDRSIGDLNRSIVLFNFHRDIFEIWGMNKEESDKCMVFSWSSLLVIIDPYFKIREPLLFLSSDELLMEEEGLVMVYNIKTQHFKYLSIEGLPFTFQATFFVKTLVSVKGGINEF